MPVKDSNTNSISQMKLRHAYAGVFFLVLLSGLSFYLTDGYMGIGDAKYDAFRVIVSYGIIPWPVLAVIDILWEKIGFKEISGRIRSLFGDRCGMWTGLFVLSAIISTLTSNYRTVSVYGNDGWHMGLYTILLMAALYVLAVDFFGSACEGCVRMTAAGAMLITSVVFILGILNRFSIYPLELYGKQEDYISTLGNINWYCGYWCIWMAVGCGIFLYSDTMKDKVISGIYTELAAVAGICCGASSAYLAFGAILLCTFFITCRAKEYMRRFIYLVIIIFSALPIIRFIGIFRVNRMWYDSALLRMITFSYQGVAVWAVVCLVCILILRFGLDEKKKYPDRMRIRGCLVGILAGGALALIGIIVLNSIVKGGIWPFRGIGILTFRDEWGNGRGLIWKITVELIGETPLINNFFGAGCDCFCSYAYNVEDIAIRLYREWGDLILTNAHSEALTMFVNQGIFGLVTYFGMIFVHLFSGIGFMDGHEGFGYAPKTAAVSAAAIAAYTAVGLVGFWQILATPFLFIMMGAAAGLIKRDTITIMNCKTL